jgi:PleD family two-component response regulator
VRALAILHPRSSTGRYLTVSAGVVTTTGARSHGPEALVEAVQRALLAAQAAGGNRAVTGEIKDDD